MQNSDIAKVFHEIAELLEVSNENIFKIRAFEKAAQTVSSYFEELENIYKAGGLKALENIEGIGAATAQIIEDLIKTGRSKRHQELLHKFPKGFVELLEVPGIGPKTALLLNKEFKIESVHDLEKAVEKGLLKNIPGFKEKKLDNIKKGLELKKKVQGRFLLSEATEYADLLVNEIKESKGQAIEELLIAGSLRRGQETVGDIDILIVSSKPKPIMDYFVKLQLVDRVLAHGETKSSVILKNGMQADLRVVPKESFGAAAHYFTGSKGHNIHIRQLAKDRGWKVNEYGIFDKHDKQIGGQTEEDMFSKFNLQYIPPELREMRGEFEAAAEGTIPKLVQLSDIKGDLHMHTKATDGANTIEEMAQAAKDLGYEYVAITDHSVSTRIAGGLTEKEALAHIKEIHSAASKIKGIKILAGTECDIKPDGSMDYPNESLKQFDYVIASVHSSFKMPKEKMTERIVKAVENPYVMVLGHPSGRLIGKRDPYEVDMEKVIEACKRSGTAIELNSFPDRLDITDVWCKKAKELGVKIIISTDSHATEHLYLIKYGVKTARRGWLEKKDVLNTLPLDKFLKAIQK